jgi:hypothetical protein
LTASTRYYVRAYATNSAGVGYGQAVAFTTSDQPAPPTANAVPALGLGAGLCFFSLLLGAHYARRRRKAPWN